MTDLSEVKRYTVAPGLEDGISRLVAESDFNLALAKIAALEKALAERERDAIDPDAQRFHQLCQGGPASEFFVGRNTPHEGAGVFEVLSGEALCEALDAAIDGHRHER